MPPLLFTSIPPRLRGHAFEPGRPDLMQAAVIRSWIAAGFQPVSINMDREVAGNPQLGAALRENGVESIVLTTPADRPHAGPLCSLSDFLRAIAGRGADAAAAIINADIEVAPAADRPLADLVDRLDRAEHLVAQRTDVVAQGKSGRRVTVHPHGFDFFAFHGSWIERVRPVLAPALKFGMPWWDHYLPLALVASGCHTRLVHSAWFRHGAHLDRWNRGHYCRIGRLAMRHFQDALERAGDAVSSRGWLDALELETVPGGLTGPCADRVRRIATHDVAPDVIAVRVLGRLAAANVRLVLQSATCGPEPAPPRQR